MTSPATTLADSDAISLALSATGASGSYPISAANPSAMPRVGTTLTMREVWASTCSATGMMFLLLGRMTTWSAGTASTAARRSAVEGFIDWPPATMPCTPRL